MQAFSCLQLWEIGGKGFPHPEQGTGERVQPSPPSPIRTSHIYSKKHFQGLFEAERMTVQKPSGHQRQALSTAPLDLVIFSRPT